MRIHILFRVCLVVCLAGVGALLGARTIHRIKDGSTPVVFEVSPSNPGPNSQVSITIELDSPTATGQVITIGSTDPGAFTDLPGEVVVPAGSASFTFMATTSNVYTRWTVLAATANGATALAIQVP